MHVRDVQRLFRHHRRHAALPACIHCVFYKGKIYKDGKKENVSFSIDPEQVKQQMITDGKKEEKIQLRITRNLKEKLEELAKQEDKSVSDYIRDLIIEKLN